MKLYLIRDWHTTYENASSRKIGDLRWVPIPNKHDGEHYTSIITHPEGAIIFSAWVLLVEVASRCDPRGVLIKDDRTPHTEKSLSLKTRAPENWFTVGIAYITQNTNWLITQEVKPTPLGYQVPTSLLPASYRLPGPEQKGMEGKGTEGNRTESSLPGEAETWNRLCLNLPKVSACGESRMKHLRARRQDTFWVQHFPDAVVRLAASGFCNGKNDRQWKATFDFLIERADAVAKTVEGLYDDRKPVTNQTDKHKAGF